MKNLDHKPNKAGGVVPARCAESLVQEPGGQPHLDAAHSDYRLVQRCLLADLAAWDELYQQCHRPLCNAIQAILGWGSCDLNLVDEVAARVWYALVANDGELLSRYDPNCGFRLLTFLAALARSEVKGYFRSEHRRRNREMVARQGWQEPSNAGAGGTLASPEDLLASIQIDEFLATLTPAAKRFFTESLFLPEPEGGGAKIKSSMNCRQRRHRLHRKLRDFLGRE